MDINRIGEKIAEILAWALMLTIFVGVVFVAMWSVYWTVSKLVGE